MIQATELRIGNYLTYHTPDDTDMPCKIDAQDILNISTNYMHNAEIHSPIPLTEEILLKCGFEIDYHIGDDVNFTIGNIDIRKRSGMDYYVFYNKETQVRILHIHQLQNLYWCLCGKELEVNL